MTSLGLYLNRTYMYKVLAERPNKSKRAPTQRFIWQSLFPWHNFGDRNILFQRAREGTRLATIYGPEGQPLSPPEMAGDQMLVTLMDIKAYNTVNPSVVQQDVELGEMLVSKTLRSNSAWNIRVRDKVTKIIEDNAERIDNTLELLAMGALKNNFVWPPVDDSGNTIANPPAYWQTDIGETSWTFGLPTDLNQDLASLVDYNGSAATSDQRKYWSDATADIIGALEVMNQVAVQKYGFELRNGTILCRSTLLPHLIKNTPILNLLRGDNNEQTGARGFLTIPQLEQYFKTGIGYTFAPYDTHWTYESGLSKSADHTQTMVHYLRENEIIILPPNGLPAVMGTAPLEQEDESWAPGIMPWYYRDPKPPYIRQAGSHVVAWPVFDYLNWARLQVLA